jgi:hypothetical protein
MGWELRRGRLYLYRNRRINGKPVKEYLGAEGPFGELLAYNLERRQGQAAMARMQERQTRAEFRTRIEELLDATKAANAQLRTVADGLLWALGYHKHNRGEWRMSRGLNHVASEIAQLSQKVREGPTTSKSLVIYTAPADDAEAVEIFAKARRGDADAKKRIQSLIHERKWVDWIGDIGRQATRQLLSKASGGDPVWEAGIIEKVKALRAELLGDSPSVLEELLVRRVVNGWITTHALELEMTLSWPNDPKARDYLDRALTRAQKRLTDAIRELARVLPKIAGNGFDGPDAELLAIAFAAKNGVRIRAYWNGDYQVKPSASEALLGLAQLLAFYTGPDEVRLDRLVTRSPLFAATETERVKWSSARRGGSWGVVYVVRKAIATCAAFYQPHGVRSPGTRLSSSLNSPPTCVRTYGHPPRTSAERLTEVCRTLSQGRPQGRFYLSERTAAEWLGVSKTAARKALLRLLASGVIVRTRKGTYRDRKNSAFVFRGWTPPTADP